jgi:hypothetical protein
MKPEKPFIILLILAAVLCMAMPARGSKDADLPGFLSATYSLIGKKPGSNQTYSGSVTIKTHGDTIEVIRCIGSSRLAGSGSIVAITADKIPNLKVRWREGKDEYEALYVIQGDADNYARLSGPYVRLRDNGKPGWELLYVDPDGANTCK